MANENLTDQLRALRALDDPNLTMSEPAYKAYRAAIRTYRAALEEQLKTIEGLGYLGASAGGFNSAIQTKSQMELNANGPAGARETLKNYIAYLDEYEGLLNATAKRLLSEL